MAEAETSSEDESALEAGECFLYFEAISRQFFCYMYCSKQAWQLMAFIHTNIPPTSEHKGLLLQKLQFTVFMHVAAQKFDNQFEQHIFAA